MKRSRREFLKVASLSVIGLGAQLATGKVAGAADAAEQYGHHENALTAKRWAMVIDTREFDSAASYQKLIDVCHAHHNVPDIPNDQEIKWLWTDSFKHTFPEQQNNFPAEEIMERAFPLLCNHCEHPPCVKVCPTQATFQRPDGIIAMDYHRCIGCRFCMAGCPYGARSFNFGNPRNYLDMAKINPKLPTRMRGVVEKCNFCVESLAEGKMPACVEAAEGKIVFGDLHDPDSEIRRVLAENFTIRRKPALGTQPGVYYII